MNMTTFNITAGEDTLENKSFKMLVRLLVRDGKLLNSDMTSEYMLSHNSNNDKFAISGKTCKGEEIVLHTDIIDGEVDIAQIAVTTEQGRVNLGSAILKRPLSGILLTMLLPGLLKSGWNTYNNMKADADVMQGKKAAIDELKAERDSILASLSGKPTAAATVRTNYRNQIDAIKAS